MPPCVADSFLQVTPAGLYCPPGDFHIDPSQPVARAIVSHAHADHFVSGCGSYLVSDSCRPLLQHRLGGSAPVHSVAYGQSINMGGVRVSLHPAGHIRGSAQIRLEHRGQVVVVSGDYKCGSDPTCEPWEPLRCHVFLTESTFGLPIYRWPAAADVLAELRRWRTENRAAGRASVLFAYALGKAQRLLALLPEEDGPIWTHGAIEGITAIYRRSGVRLAATRPVAQAEPGVDWSQALILAPPAARNTPWLRRFGGFSAAMASGWMRVRGLRRRRALDQGFVLSDHADWPGLLDAVRAVAPQRVAVTHGHAAALAAWLRQAGIDAEPLATGFRGEAAEELAAGEEPDASQGEGQSKEDSVP